MKLWTTNAQQGVRDRRAGSDDGSASEAAERRSVAARGTREDSDEGERNKFCNQVTRNASV